ncbi:ATP-binding protein [Haliovirga abyssi]|uniref:histidine kinase n=1 Tax=Haliovirga abyssi TaxID=2996794 RepID=A0AAU9D656_9FUSO|nr:ATP-binding protein [Haliovirga abyssi]BDU50028.1 hypothetical protein HLVA_05970 [Haliovirga abyssi]
MGIEYDLKKAYEDVITVFYDISKDMNSTFDKGEIIDISFSLLKKVVNYDAISLFKYSKDKDMYLVEKAQGYNSTLKSSLFNIVNDGLIKWAAKLGKPFVNIEKVGEIKTTIIVPLISKDELMGAIILHTKEDENYFDQNRLKILTILSSQLSISFENLNLYENLEKRNGKLKALKNYMDNIIKSMINGIIVIDNENKIRVFNNMAEQLLKKRKRKVMYKSIIDTDLNKKFINEMVRLKVLTEKGKKVNEVEFEYEIDEDTTYPLGISTTLLKEENKILGIIFSLRDLRESKELQELRRVDKLKDEFLSMVSHELRTPLTSIKAYTETLMFMVEDNDPETQLEFLTIINEESERLTRLINDVLDLSKIEAGKMSFILKAEDIGAIIRRIVKNMTGFAETKNIELIENIKENLPEVMIDKDRVMQVLTNLINNAVKFTPENGKIFVNADFENDKFLRISVKDTGIGIKEEDKGKVFEKFKQVDDILVREAGGTGLGLPICKNIIEYFGGKIWVDSVHGEGSTFQFTLPIVEV